MNGQDQSVPPTQGDVAKALGLSQATVSLALRDDCRISENRRREIQQFALSMGYQPSSAAVSLAHRRHARNTIPRGDVFAWINYWDDPTYLHRMDEFHQYYLGACETADKLGYILKEFTFDGRVSLKRLGKILITRGIKGIMLPPHPVDFKFEGFDWNNFSFIKFGYSIVNPRGHVVSPHQSYNTFLAFEKIHERGYKRIGYVEGINRYLYFDAGYLRGQRRLPVKDHIPIFTYDHKDIPEAKRRLLKWLNQYRPDAIISEVAMLQWILQDIGYRIPQDIGLAATSILDGGVDAGINQHANEIGRVGVLSLISILHDSDRGIPGLDREVLVKGSWVDGDSLPRRN